MTFVAASLITGGAAIAGGYLASRGAQKGAQIQADAAQQSVNLQRQMFDTTNTQQAPYRSAGYNALNQIGQLGSGTYGMYGPNGEDIGTGTGTGYLTRQFSPEDFKAGIDPSYNFRLQQGNMATANMANRAGGLIGGNALTGINDYAQGMASTEYGNAFNRFNTQRSNIYNNLASIAGLGQTSLGQTTNASVAAGSNIGNAISNVGTALGSGQVAQYNALGGGLAGAGSSYMLSQLLAPKKQAPDGYGMSDPNTHFGGTLM